MASDGTASSATVLAPRRPRRLGGHHRVHRQHQPAARRGGRRANGRDGICGVFRSRPADADAVGRQKRVGHRAAQDQHVGGRRQPLEQRDLVADLGPAHDGRKRPRRPLHDGVQGPQLGQQEVSGGGGQRVRQPSGAGVRPVRGTERVVDVAVGQARQRAHVVRVVGLLAGDGSAGFRAAAPPRRRGRASAARPRGPRCRAPGAPTRPACARGAPRPAPATAQASRFPVVGQGATPAPPARRGPAGHGWSAATRSMRESSRMALPSSGTLRSARTNTRRPSTSRSARPRFMRWRRWTQPDGSGPYGAHCAWRPVGPRMDFRLGRRLHESGGGGSETRPTPSIRRACRFDRSGFPPSRE